MAKRGLGRGLNALISENYVKPDARGKSKSSPASVGPVAVSERPSVLPIGALHAGKYQPRTHFDDNGIQELADSIRKNGVMQPVLVRASGEHPGKYEIIAGERRFRAAKIAEISEIPVLVRELSDEQALELALIENIQRQDLSPLEEAAGYQRLIDEFGYSQDKLAESIGKSRSHVANTIRLIALPDEVKSMIERGELTAGHARALLTAPNPLDLARRIVRAGLNVRQAEEASRDAKGVAPKRRRTFSPLLAPVAGVEPARPKDPDICALEESLSENLGVRVSIIDRGPSGEIILYYDSLAGLDEILKRLSNSV